MADKSGFHLTLAQAVAEWLPEFSEFVPLGFAIIPFNYEAGLELFSQRLKFELGVCGDCHSAELDAITVLKSNITGGWSDYSIARRLQALVAHLMETSPQTLDHGLTHLNPGEYVIPLQPKKGKTDSERMDDLLKELDSKLPSNSVSVVEYLNSSGKPSPHVRPASVCRGGWSSAEPVWDAEQQSFYVRKHNTVRITAEAHGADTLTSFTVRQGSQLPSLFPDGVLDHYLYVQKGDFIEANPGEMKVYISPSFPITSINTQQRKESAPPSSYLPETDKIWATTSLDHVVEIASGELPVNPYFEGEFLYES